MADGLNDARAMRVAEIMTDFRNLQHYLAQIRATPSAEEYYLEGHATLRSCIAEAQAVLARPFASTTSPAGNAELQKAQLRSVIMDASVRRFQCQRAYLRATAALRWIDSRNAVLRGQRATAAHQAHLQVVDNALRAELAQITDERVEYSLRAQDAAQKKWLAEDPSLAMIRWVLASRR